METPLKSGVRSAVALRPEPGSVSKNRTTLLVLVSSVLFVHFVVWLLPGIFEVWELQAGDQLFRLRYYLTGPDTISRSIAHVDIDNSSIRTLNTTFAGREQYGEVTSILSRSLAASVGYDIIFARKGGLESDKAIVAAVREAGNIYFPVAFTLSDRPSQVRQADEPYPKFIDGMKWNPRIVREGEPYEAGPPLLTVFDELGEAARGIGFINVVPDRDGAFRRVPLLVKFHDGYYPSLPFRIVCDYLHVDPDSISVAFGERIILHDALLPDGEIRNVSIPIDERGQVLVNYPAGWGIFYHFSFAKVLEDGNDPAGLEKLRDLLDGSLVVVSEVATGASDIGATPYETDFPLSGLHSSVLNMILTGDYLRDVDPWAGTGIEALFLLVIAAMSLHLRPLRFFVASFFLVAVYDTVYVVAFLRLNIFVMLVAPGAAMLFAIASVLGYRYFSEEREKIFFRRTFENYFSRPVLRKIMERPELLSLGGEKKELTILFSDIAGFTGWSQSQNPDIIKRTLNDYFEEMANIVFRYDGTIDKYIGDGMMAFFGDPLPREDHAMAAVKAAVDMQKKIRELKERWEPEGGLPIKVRIGINTGEVVVGNMGSRQRMDYTVLGANVNLAQRLESSAPVEGILISGSVYKLVRNSVRTRSRGAIRLKGLTRKVRVYEVMADGER